jgi:hypothetical protein
LRAAVVTLYLAASFFIAAGAWAILRGLSARRPREVVAKPQGEGDRPDVPPIVTPSGRAVYGDDPAAEVLAILRAEPVREQDRRWWLEARGRYSRSPYKNDPEFGPVRLHLIAACKKLEAAPRIGDEVIF